MDVYVLRNSARIRPDQLLAMRSASPDPGILMHISRIAARKIHKTQDRCTHCGEPYRWQSVDGVLLNLCPTCRAADLREWEDRRMVQEPLSGPIVHYRPGE